MAVPKRKTSKARRDQRSSTWFIRPQIVAFCSEESCTGEPKLPHRVCLKCGYYKGRKVITTKYDRDAKRSELAAARSMYQRAQQAQHEKEVLDASVKQENQ